MKMRELEQRTGVRRESIRVYFRKGLLPPARLIKPNVAEYGDEHVRGIQTIRRLLDEQRLSLDEIKQAISGQALGRVDAMAVRHLDELVAARLGADSDLVPLATVLGRNPEAEIDAKAMQKQGAIELISRKGEKYLSRVDAQIVGIWGEMRAAGFNEELGFSADLVSIYVRRADELAQAEISEFLKRVTGFSTEEKAEWAQVGLTSMMALFSMLRMKSAIKAIKNGIKDSSP